VTGAESKNGLLIIDKPAGPTSHDVVAWARRVLREKRIGHTGTLDPMATGVLPLVIGKATRLASLLSATEKEYEATVRLGAATDTYDSSGSPFSAMPFVDPGIPTARIEEALARFRGTFEQVPPPYSAKKVAGVPAYELARKQKPVELAAVMVTVHSLELLEIGPGAVRLRMRTSPGFYVRSLAHDLGVQLGCGAHLEALRRIRAGRFGIDQAVPLDVIDRTPEAALGALIPVEEIATDLPAVRVNPLGAQRTAHGNFLRPQDLAETGPVPGLGALAPEPGTGPVFRIIDGEGRLLAVAARGADGVLRPSIVLV
jgi:tRNA pseudouridine55 synthase